VCVTVCVCVCVYACVCVRARARLVSCAFAYAKASVNIARKDDAAPDGLAWHTRREAHRKRCPILAAVAMSAESSSVHNHNAGQLQTVMGSIHVEFEWNSVEHERAESQFTLQNSGSTHPDAALGRCVGDDSLLC
jgi:hypothetical protein